MSNTELWDKLGKTDPAHTKGFSRSGGFKGTAIKPMFSYRRMTEEFGPCGKGWGINQPSFQVVPADKEVLVFCTVSIWHGDRDTVVYGVGGDKCLVSQSNGLRADDEAFKKAFTDAVTNALKLIGVGADVHMGLFDDQKYVNTMNVEFGNTEAPKPKPEHTPEQKAAGALSAANAHAMAFATFDYGADDYWKANSAALNRCIARGADGQYLYPAAVAVLEKAKLVKGGLVEAGE